MKHKEVTLFVDIYDRGVRLKELRLKNNMTQQNVADVLGVTRTTISAYEQYNKAPSVELLEKLAILYNTSTDYILGLESASPIYLNQRLTPRQRALIEEFIEKITNEFLNK